MIPDPNTPGPSTTNHRVTTLLPPPTTVEPHPVIAPTPVGDDNNTNTTGADIQRVDPVARIRGFYPVLHPVRCFWTLILEVEFLHCCSYLVSEADDGVQGYEKSRVVSPTSSGISWTSYRHSCPE